MTSEWVLAGMFAAFAFGMVGIAGAESSGRDFVLPSQSEGQLGIVHLAGVLLVIIKVAAYGWYWWLVALLGGVGKAIVWLFTPKDNA